MPTYCPRHSRTQPFVMRIRSFACTRSISSFHRLTETSEPSSSTAFASHTFPVEPPRLEKSRTAPFWRIVRSITSTLLSGRSSFTFIRSALREGPVSHKHFRPREAGRMEKGGRVPSGNKGRSVGPIRGFPNSFEHRNKTYNGRARYRGVGFFESHQGCQRSGRTRADSPRSRQRREKRGLQRGVRGLEDRARDRGKIRPGRLKRPAFLREDETRGDEAESARQAIASARLPRPSDHPVRGLDRDYGPPPRPPTGPRQARDDPCGSHRARTRGGRDPRLDPRPVSRAHGPKRRGTVRRILRHHDGNPLEAYIEGVEGAKGSPHDVRVAARQSDPTNRARQSARRGGSGKGATRGLRPRRLQRGGGQPTSLRGCRSRHFPRPDHARGVAPARTGRSPPDSTEPERQVRDRLPDLNQQP